jgi:hypothetical protein
MIGEGKVLCSPDPVEGPYLSHNPRAVSQVASTSMK